MWDKHFFGPWAFNATPDQYDAAIAERYGKPENIEEYCRKAQLLNIETNQACMKAGSTTCGKMPRAS